MFATLHSESNPKQRVNFIKLKDVLALIQGIFSCMCHFVSDSLSWTLCFVRMNFIRPCIDMKTTPSEYTWKFLKTGHILENSGILNNLI